MSGSPRGTLNGVNQPEEMVTGAGRGQGNRVRLQKLCLFGTASPCGHRRISGCRFSQPISVKRSDDRKYVCVRRVGNNKDP